MKIYCPEFNKEMDRAKKGLKALDEIIIKEYAKELKKIQGGNKSE